MYIFTLTEEDSELLIRIDIDKQDNFDEIPSPNVPHDLTEIHNLYPLVSFPSEPIVIDIDQVASDLCGSEEIIDNSFEDIEVKEETHHDRTQGVPLFISDNANGLNENKTESRPCVVKSESENEYGTMIPTTVETVNKWDKSRKEKLSRGAPRPKSIQSMSYSF